MSHFESSFSKGQSSLVSGIHYNYDTLELTVKFHKYYTDEITYLDVETDMVSAFSASQSLGKFYLTYIKPNFKHKNVNYMADVKNKPKGINQSSDKKRFIKMRINVLEIKKEWLMAGEKGTYLDATLQLLPDGEVDKFEQLGMITQDVPKEVYTKDKKAVGPILGNAKELLWNANGAEGSPGSDLPAGGADDNDLPF